MFDKQYRFKGRHALRVDQLTGVFDELSKAKLIDRNVDVYANAPLIGFCMEELLTLTIPKIRKPVRYIIRMSWVIV